MTVQRNCCAALPLTQPACYRYAVEPRLPLSHGTQSLPRSFLAGEASRDTGRDYAIRIFGHRMRAGIKLTVTNLQCIIIPASNNCGKFLVAMVGTKFACQHDVCHFDEKLYLKIGHYSMGVGQLSLIK